MAALNQRKDSWIYASEEIQKICKEGNPIKDLNIAIKHERLSGEITKNMDFKNKNDNIKNKI